MKLLQYHYYYDFGHEFYIIIGVFKYFNLIQISFRWDDYFTWIPHVGLRFIEPQIFGFFTQIMKFYFSIEFIHYRYPTDLES